MDVESKDTSAIALTNVIKSIQTMRGSADVVGGRLLWTTKKGLRGLAVSPP
jgi:hypothetical protein